MSQDALFRDCPLPQLACSTLTKAFAGLWVPKADFEVPITRAIVQKECRVNRVNGPACADVRRLTDSLTCEVTDPQGGIVDQGQKCHIWSIVARAEWKRAGRGKAAQIALEGSKPAKDWPVRAGDKGGGQAW